MSARRTSGTFFTVQRGLKFSSETAGHHEHDGANTARPWPSTRRPPVSPGRLDCRRHHRSPYDARAAGAPGPRPCYLHHRQPGPARSSPHQGETGEAGFRRGRDRCRADALPPRQLAEDASPRSAATDFYGPSGARQLLDRSKRLLPGDSNAVETGLLGIRLAGLALG